MHHFFSKLSLNPSVHRLPLPKAALATGVSTTMVAFAALVGFHPDVSCCEALVDTQSSAKASRPKSGRRKVSRKDDPDKYAKQTKPVIPQPGGLRLVAEETEQHRAICMLRKSDGRRSTGVLVSLQDNGLTKIGVLTCNHVFPEEFVQVDALFGYTQPGRVTEARRCKLRPEHLFLTSRILDYTLVGIDERCLFGSEPPSPLPKPIVLDLPRRMAFPGVAVRVVGHGRGSALHSAYGVVSAASRNGFNSTCAHEPGMSGAPVFVDGDLAGLHKGYYKGSDQARHTHLSAIIGHASRELQQMSTRSISDDPVRDAPVGLLATDSADRREVLQLIEILREDDQRRRRDSLCEVI